MSPLVTLGVYIAGGAGALARLLLDGGVSIRAGRAFPWGILAVNALGAFALGVLVGAGLRGSGYELAATGFVGSFTTFSTWMLESHWLAAHGHPARAFANVSVSLVLGVGAVWAGAHLATAL